LSKSLDILPESAPQVGDRFPWLRLMLTANGPSQDLFQKLSDLHFNLILLDQPPPAEGGTGLGDLLRTYVIPTDPSNDQELARVHIPRPSFYLVRPDGNIGLCGTRFEANSVANYVSQNLQVHASELRTRRASASG
jgi:hypothetical protein